jgi:glycosyltransferase involved in cell wall biosynthesis
MRVAIIAPFHDLGGSEHQLLLLLRALPAQGVEVLFCHFNIRSDALRAEVQSLAGCQELEIKARSFKNPWDLWQDAGALSRLLQAHQVQVVNGWNYPGHIIGGLAAWRAGLPCLYSFRGLDPWKAGWRLPFFRLINWLADGFVFQSTLTRDLICRREGIPISQTSIIPNAIDRTRFRPGDRTAARRWLHGEYGLDEHVPLVLSVGSLRPIKGHDVLLQAVRKLSHAHPSLRFRVLIVGEGPLRAAYEEMASDLPVSFAGFRDDVKSFYQAADIYCQPSRSEALPNAVLEAMSCGLPIVAPDVGAVPDLVGGDNGLLFQPGDIDGLYGGLHKLLASPEQRASMGEASLARSRRFSVDQTVTQYRRLFESVSS